MELLIGCLVVAAIVRHLPGAIQDLVVAWRASKAGEWDVIDRQQARRDADSARRAERRARLAEKLAERRRRRHDPDRRPGIGDIAADVYHGACEDALEKRRAKRRRAGRRLDPRRVTDRVEEKLAEEVPCEEPPRRVNDHVDVDEAADLFNDTLDADGLDLIRQRRCCWPTATRPDGSFVYCGAPAADGYVYCDPHCDEADREDEPDRTPEPGEPPNPKGDEPVTTPPVDGTHDPIFIKSPGGTMSAPTAEEVQTNEAARRAFDQIAEGADELAEAAAMAERARAKMAAAAHGAADGMSAIRFDAGATSAAGEAVDAVGNDTLSAWCEKAEAARAAAQSGKASLEKYRDAEDVVSSNNVDSRTLEPSQS